MKKAIVIVIVCAVFSGSLSVGKAAMRAPSPAAQSRFSVFSLLSSMELPLATAGTLSGVPLYPEFKGRPEAEDRDDRSQTKDGTIRIADVGMRLICRNDVPTSSPFPFVSAGTPYQCMAPPGFPAIPYFEMIAAFLLSYVGLLRRSNLPGEAIAMFARYCPVTF